MKKPRLNYPKITLLSLSVLAVASPAHALIMGMTDIALSPDPGASTIVDTTLLTSFTTSEGTYTGLQGAVSLSLGISTPYWGQDSSSSGNSSLLGLDVSNGAANIGTNDISFEQVVDSAAAFFMTEFLFGGSQDDVTLVPLDLAGDAIGDFSLTITNAQWGAALNAQHILGSGIDFQGNVRGVTFQLSDFEGAGTLSGVAGLRITSANADPSVIGFATAIPEPETYALFGGCLSLAFVCLRRRLKTKR